jgi:hypothetical protein
MLKAYSDTRSVAEIKNLAIEKESKFKKEL